MSDSKVQDNGKVKSVSVNPGICGFPCTVKAWKIDNRKIHVSITASECEHVQSLSELLHDLDMKDLFKPVSRNPIFLSAERAGCHLSCAIPLAVIKCAEAAMELAIPRDVLIQFQREELENQ